MRKKLLIEILLVLLVVAGAGYFAFVEKTKLGLDLKGGVYVVMQAKPEEGKEIKPSPDKCWGFLEPLHASFCSLVRKAEVIAK